MSGLDKARPNDPPFIPWSFPEHDSAVVEVAMVAHQYADKMGLMMGVGVLDFADGTVVVLSKKVPVGDTFVSNRRDENHYVAGYAADPFANMESVPDFTENLEEISADEYRGPKP